ncbi:MAG: DUF3298 and DUF4163 domain-containing protein [Melioribacteraceae bacterium]|nr:DUF3298 and DUF4163 domain-containing protein [Melioribacteraceae bacterium]
MKNLKILFVLTLLSVYACSQNDKQELTYTMVALENRSIEADTSAANATVIKLNYPKIISTNSEVIKKCIQDSIDKFILSEMFDIAKMDQHENMLKQFINEYENFKKDFPDYKLRWYLIKNVKVIFSNNQIISLAMINDSFTGGAHPNYTKYFMNLDLDRGSKIKLSDIIVDDKISELNKIAERKFREINNLDSVKTLSDLGYWFENDKFEVNENFAITAEGITFYYNSYEIAPYSLGQTTLFISYKDLDGIISVDKYKLTVNN